MKINYLRVTILNWKKKYHFDFFSENQDISLPVYLLIDAGGELLSPLSRSGAVSPGSPLIDMSSY